MSGRSPVKVFFGWCLMAVGGLIALSCGLCTFGFVVTGMITAVGTASSGHVAGLLTALPGIVTVLMFGGLPTLVGAGVFVAGREMTRKREPGVAR